MEVWAIWDSECSFLKLSVIKHHFFLQDWWDTEQIKMNSANQEYDAVVDSESPTRNQHEKVRTSLWHIRGLVIFVSQMFMPYKKFALHYPLWASYLWEIQLCLQKSQHLADLIIVHVFILPKFISAWYNLELSGTLCHHQLGVAFSLWCACSHFSLSQRTLIRLMMSPDLIQQDKMILGFFWGPRTFSNRGQRRLVYQWTSFKQMFRHWTAVT